MVGNKKRTAHVGGTHSISPTTAVFHSLYRLALRSLAALNVTRPLGTRHFGPTKALGRGLPTRGSNWAGGRA